LWAIILTMRPNPKTTTITGSAAANTAATVRRQIENGGERLWRLADFDGLPFLAVAQILSRLSRQGVIRRLGKEPILSAPPHDIW
jgi:hypothetical protein